MSNRTDFTIRWLDAAEETKLDVVIVPPEGALFAAASPWRIPVHQGESAARKACTNVLEQLALRVFPELDAVAAISDLPAILELPFRHRWPQYWTQEKLAYAFTLAKLGRQSEGMSWLEQSIADTPQMPRRIRDELRRIYLATSPGGA